MPTTKSSQEQINGISVAVPSNGTLEVETDHHPNGLTNGTSHSTEMKLGSEELPLNGSGSSQDPESKCHSKTPSPEPKVRFNEDDIPCANSSGSNGTCDPNNAEDCGAKDVNPTLWLGEDQMLLLPGNGRSEETDSNSGTSDTKSFEGLLSPNGTSILWDEDTDWILLFDNMIRYADRKQQRTTRSCGCRGPKTEDETHSTLQVQSTLPKSTSKRASSAPPSRRAMFASSKSIPSASSGGAGGADEEMFMKSFENVPKITLYSAKDLEAELIKIKDVLGNSTSDWEKRVESIKAVRSLILAGCHEYEEFYSYLRQLELPFQSCVKDLRSQVVREACITIAYLSQQLGAKLDHFAEALLPCLINLIQNSAKIMSTAGIVAIRFIIRYTHVSRLIPIITSHLTSKSKDIRRTCFEFLNQLLVTWPTHPLEKHVVILTDAIRRGISDADADARAYSRKAFWSFADHFRDQADSLLSSLDNSKQRMLHDAFSMSNSSSNSSLTQNGKSCRSHGSNSVGSVESLSPSQSSTLGRRTGISNLPTPKQNHSSGIPTQLRSTSAIDLAAVRRAKARAAYSTIANLPRGSGASLPQSARAASKRSDMSLQGVSSPERVIQRPRGSSRSQPSSRPESPSSRLSYATYSYSTTDGKSNRTRSKSGIPVPTSRDASPSRTTFAHERRLSGSRSRLASAGEKHLSPSPSAGPLTTEKTLQPSREAEVAVADALRTPARRRYNAFEDQSDESETSSICSDRSFSSFGRNVDDINEVIHSLHSIHWSDRKEGLQALHGYFRSGRTLSLIELKKVTDIFSKIFMDPHTKVFSLFLDTLNELIIVHKNDLHAWLYILLTRLFLKIGCDILGSVLSKIQKTLELIKESFPCENQFSTIVRFLNDQTQTPNTKVKTALLKYLHSLICIMDPSKFSSANPEVCAAFMKIISWTASPKCSDLRKHGEDVLVALFGLNPSEYSNFIDQLPKGYKDSAFQLLHSRYPRSNPDTSRSLSNQTSTSPARTLSPSSAHPWSISQGGTPQNCSFDFDDTENLNPEEISSCWKKTVSEIEGFKSGDFYDKVPDKLNLDPELQSLGSQLSSPDQFTSLELNLSNGSSPTKKSSSECSSLNFPCSEASLMLDKELEEVSSLKGNEIDGSLSTHNQKTIYSIINELDESSKEERKVKALDCLISLAREQSSIISEDDFRIILREVIHTISDKSLPVKTLALQALCELIKSKTKYFQDYIELTLLRILEAHKDTDVDVLMMADMCAVVASVSLPPEQCVRILNALILTEPMPVNQAAIKMMSKLVEHHSEQVVLKLLPDIMPGLIKAYDNQESTVRKAAVFCMVAVHSKVGEVMQPHLASLNSCKIKLLNVYIKKAQQQPSSCNGSPGSPSKLSPFLSQ